MTHAAWGADSNPLTALFRKAYDDLRTILDEQCGKGGVQPLVSAAMASAAADAMAPRLRDISLQLRRSATLLRGQGPADLPNILLYAFVAVADEALINSDWPGSSAWSARLLERDEFNTQLAGERLFQRISEAAKGPRSRANVEVAALYLDCLNLGFQGKYRGTSFELADLAALRRELFLLVYQRDAGLRQPHYCLSEPPGLNLVHSAAPRLRFGERIEWYMVALAALALPLLVSSALWFELRAKPAEVIEQIESAHSRLAQPQ